MKLERLTSRFALPLTVLLALSVGVRAPVAPHDARGVTLLLQGAGPVISSRAGDETWGEYLPDADGRLRWTGFVGELVQRHGWKMGGVLRPQAEQVLPEHLDLLGSVPADQADLYILASSLPSQQDGIDSRARELASAVAMLRLRTGAQQVRLVAYSAAGVAARVWLQGGLANQPYQTGSVDRLICVAPRRIWGLARRFARPPSYRLGTRRSRPVRRHSSASTATWTCRRISASSTWSSKVPRCR
jgi:hypothetical protein